MKRKLKILVFDRLGSSFSRMVDTVLLEFVADFEFEFAYVWPLTPGRIAALAQQAWDLVLMDQYPGTENIVA